MLSCACFYFICVSGLVMVPHRGNNSGWCDTGMDGGLPAFVFPDSNTLRVPAHYFPRAHMLYFFDRFVDSLAASDAWNDVEVDGLHLGGCDSSGCEPLRNHYESILARPQHAWRFFTQHAMIEFRAELTDRGSTFHMRLLSPHTLPVGLVGPELLLVVHAHPTCAVADMVLQHLAGCQEVFASKNALVDLHVGGCYVGIACLQCVGTLGALKKEYPGRVLLQQRTGVSQLAQVVLVSNDATGAGAPGAGLLVLEHGDGVSVLLAHPCNGRVPPVLTQELLQSLAAGGAGIVDNTDMRSWLTYMLLCHVLDVNFLDERHILTLMFAGGTKGLMGPLCGVHARGCPAGLSPAAALEATASNSVLRDHTLKVLRSIATAVLHVQRSRAWPGVLPRDTVNAYMAEVMGRLHTLVQNPLLRDSRANSNRANLQGTGSQPSPNNGGA